jgi:TonB family protein
MSHREVWEIMDGKGERGTEMGISGLVSTAVYRVEGGSLAVRFDRQITKRGEARVATLRTKVGLILEDLIARLGVPNEGAEHLGERQPEGEMVWTDAACGVKVTVYPESSGWWQPANATMNVEVRTLPVVGAASTSQASEGSTDTNGRAPVGGPAATVAAESNPPAGTPAPAVQQGAPVNNRSLTATSFPPTNPAEPLESDGPIPYTAGVGGVSVPERIESSYVHAVYPSAAAKAQLSGRVVMQAVVRKDGSISDVLVLSCSQPDVGFEQAAIDAVEQWRFRPATLAGQPVDAYTTITIQFR